LGSNQEKEGRLAMPKLAANLSLMFTEWDFLDRFEAAADAGFAAVEFLFPYAFSPDDIAGRIARNGLVPALFNLPPGNWDAGERGLAALPDRRADFRRSVETALTYAKATGTRRLHLMSGLGLRGDAAAEKCFRDSVALACDMAGPAGVEILIEPLNGRDVPGYFLNDFDYAAQMVAGSSRSNLKLQYDIYHRQILHGDVLRSLEKLFPLIGHVQIASVPERHEPGSGELNDGLVFRRLDELRYGGYVGCEYRPANGTIAGLSWREMLLS
jgi:2-dehydrotetronate isomerase